MPTFTPIPMPLPDFITDVASHREEQKVLRAQFNDGYEQTVPAGINSMLAEWEAITWANLTKAERDTVVGVLRQVGGSGVLSWTPYPETTMKYFKVKEGFTEIFPSGVHYTVTVSLYEII